MLAKATARCAVLLALPLFAAAFVPAISLAAGARARQGLGAVGWGGERTRGWSLGRGGFGTGQSLLGGGATGVRVSAVRERVVGALLMDAGEHEAPVTCRSLTAYDTERAKQIMEQVGDHGALIAMLWTKDFCRKCMAITPKFDKMREEFKGRNIVFVEMPTGKVDKAMRLEYGVTVAPTMTLCLDGVVIEQYVPGKDLAHVPAKLLELLNKHVPETEVQKKGFGAMMEALYKTDNPPAKKRGIGSLGDARKEEGGTGSSVLGADRRSGGSGADGAASMTMLERINAPAVEGKGKGKGGSSMEEMLAQLKAAEEKNK